MGTQMNVYIKVIKLKRNDMFRPLLGHHQMSVHLLLRTYYNNYAYNLTFSDFIEANISIMFADSICILWMPWGEYRGLFPP
jgi:hypothetical protein